jgi:hypothetical protein
MITFPAYNGVEKMGQFSLVLSEIRSQKPFHHKIAKKKKNLLEYNSESQPYIFAESSKGKRYDTWGHENNQN